MGETSVVRCNQRLERPEWKSCPALGSFGNTPVFHVLSLISQKVHYEPKAITTVPKMTVSTS